ncbi:hypothetical protein Lser_V15G03484 [Lactuca serriola]
MKPKEERWFRALSQRKPDISGRAHKWNLNDRFVLRIEASNMLRMLKLLQEFGRDGEGESSRSHPSFT